MKSLTTFFTQRLMNKLVGGFLIVSLVPVILVGTLSYRSGRTALIEKTFEELQAVGNSRVSDINHLIQLRHEQAKELAGTYLVRQLESNGVNDPEDFNKIQSHIESIHQEMQLQPRSGYETIDKVTAVAIIGVWDMEGIIVANTNTDLIGKQMPAEFLQGVKTRGAFFGGFENDPLTGENFLIILQAIRDYEDDGFAGVILLKVRAQILNDITTDRAGLGESGEVYLVNNDHYMITESRFSKGAVLNQKVDSPVVINTFAGEKTLGTYFGYRGVQVVGSTHLLQDQQWVLLSEIDVSEAFAPARLLGIRILFIVLAIAIIVSFLSYRVAKSIALPISRITEKVVQVGDGDLDVRIPQLESSDEVGQLSVSFGKMVTSLRTKEAENTRMIRELQDLGVEIKEASNVLVSSSSEIAASTTQMAASAAEVASSVAETSTTVDQVRQTAELASEKATEVSVSAQQAERVSQEGSQTVQENIEGMNQIKTQMNNIAESIISLSEQNQAISEIISTVNDLAEQSNLLAVNASIEAAKAGEQGKGFSVVAQEIRKLSEQSKESTAQVNMILNDIQKATSTVVMVAEQGSNAVEQGVLLSQKSGSAIQELGKSVNEASTMATQIAASSKQQLVGVEQVVTAMDSIKEASTQNATTAKQLETSSSELEQLGQQLNELVNQYQA